MGMSVNQAQELVEFGEKIDVLVTPKTLGNTYGVSFCDMFFSDYARAALYLKHMYQTSFPENFKHLVG